MHHLKLIFSILLIQAFMNSYWWRLHGCLSCRAIFEQTLKVLHS